MGLAELVRQRISQSGLTESQIRTQLQAAGYPTTLLDQYLQADTVAEPGSDVLRALALLGLGDGSLTAGGDSTLALDSATRDSLRADSLGLFDSIPALPVFGLSVFRRASTEFQPSLAGPVDENCRLGPGDVLVLILTGDVELAHTLEVNREGFVVIPQVGQLFVNTLTLEQLRTLLFEQLGRVYSGIRRGPTATTSFEVTVARVRTVQVYVVGEVTRPGSYQIPSVGTVLAALYEAGGPTAFGNFRNIEVRRRNDLIAQLDLYDYLLRGLARQDTRLETGDVVFVPVLGKRVSIEGAVRRSAIFGLRPGETLRDLVEIAGGFRPDAVLQRITISRIVPPGQRRPDDPARMVVDVPLLPDTAVAPFPMEPGDEVRVWEITRSFGRYVELNGSVQHPGVYGWRQGMRLSELIGLAGGFRPAVYAGRAHIERLHPARSVHLRRVSGVRADAAMPLHPDRGHAVDLLAPIRAVGHGGLAHAGPDAPHPDLPVALRRVLGQDRIGDVRQRHEDAALLHVHRDHGPAGVLAPVGTRRRRTGHDRREQVVPAGTVRPSPLWAECQSPSGVPAEYNDELVNRRFLCRCRPSRCGRRQPPRRRPLDIMD